jgi:hypothetical protein
MIPTWQTFEDFLAGFTSASELFFGAYWLLMLWLRSVADYLSLLPLAVDVGTGKEACDAKIKGELPFLRIFK